VSYVQLLCLISIANIACMESYPASESYNIFLLNFLHWQFLHEIWSREWVACSFFAWFSCLMMPAWHLIQRVSFVQLLCLISMPDNACIKSHLVCELCAFPLLYFHGWQCMNEIPSSLWVRCSSFAWFLWLTMYACKFIQNVSHVQLLCLIAIADNTFMKSHTDCESCAAILLYFHCWQFLHEILSREWAICSFFGWFPLLTNSVWNPLQAVSHVQFLWLIFMTDIAGIKSYPGSKLCAAPLVDFYFWHCLHEILSSLWVMCSSFVWFLFLTLPAWNLF